MTGRLQNRRLWLAGGAVVAVVVLLVAWFGFISPELTSTASLRDQATAAQQQNDVLRAKNDKLKKQNDDAATLRADLAAALAALPSDGGLPAFTRQLSAQATASSVALTSVIVGSASPVVAAAGAATAASTTGAVTTAAATPTVASTSTLVQIPISVIATGLGKDDISFLKAIQVAGPRRALVTTSQMAPAGGDTKTGIDGICTLTLTLTIFSAPLAPAAQADLQKLLSGK